MSFCLQDFLLQNGAFFVCSDGKSGEIASQKRNPQRGQAVTLLGLTMRRSAELTAPGTVDKTQLELGERCERLLASGAWNCTHTTTHKGLLKRLQMIPDGGLAPMRVVPHSKITELGRIPRSHEGHQVDAIDTVRRCGADRFHNPKAVLLFFSHRWLRPNWSDKPNMDLSLHEDKHAMGTREQLGDPDDAERSTAKALIAYGEWFKQYRTNVEYASDASDITTSADLEIFWWIDWSCVNQDSPGSDLAALPAFAASCAGIVAAWSPGYESRAWCHSMVKDECPVGSATARLLRLLRKCLAPLVGLTHTGRGAATGYLATATGARAIALQSHRFVHPCRCQVELLLAYAFMTTGDKVFVLPDGFAGASPHDGHWVTGEDPLNWLVLADPAGGRLTNDNDRMVIWSLTGVAERSKAFSWWRVFVKNSTESLGAFFAANVLCCCQACGVFAARKTRKARLGHAAVWKVLRVASHSLRSYTAGVRSHAAIQRFTAPYTVQLYSAIHCNTHSKVLPVGAVVIAPARQGLSQMNEGDPTPDSVLDEISAELSVERSSSMSSSSRRSSSSSSSEELSTPESSWSHASPRRQLNRGSLG